MGCLEAAPCLFLARELSIEPNVERGRIRIHHCSLSVIITMPRGRALSDDTRRIIVRLCESLHLQEVVDQSGIPCRTVERILAEYKERGTVDCVKAPPRALGAPRILSRENVQVCALPDNMILPCSQPILELLEGTIRHTPDAYLDELREVVQARTGKDVSAATIWRALHRSGFTIKKVCFLPVAALQVLIICIAEQECSRTK